MRSCNIVPTLIVDWMWQILKDGESRYALLDRIYCLTNWYYISLLFSSVTRRSNLESPVLNAIFSAGIDRTWIDARKHKITNRIHCSFQYWEDMLYILTNKHCFISICEVRSSSWNCGILTSLVPRTTVVGYTAEKTSMIPRFQFDNYISKHVWTIDLQTYTRKFYFLW
jgi:hypothetical protein